MGRNGIGDPIMLLDGLPFGEAEVVAARGASALSIAAGGTVSGGSSWEPGIPTLYGSAGLAADYDLTDKMDRLPTDLSNPERDFLNYMNDIPINLPSRKKIIDASRGANYSGGSSYSPGLPLTPSNAGLAGAGSRLQNIKERMRQQMNLRVQQVGQNYQVRNNVIDPSAGANYGGGSTYYPGSPLLPSSAGLAGGCSGCGSADADLMGFESRVRQSMPGVQFRANVIDPSAGANYGGGSSYAGGLPLLPSSAGLAGDITSADLARAKGLMVSQKDLQNMDAVILAKLAPSLRKTFSSLGGGLVFIAAEVALTRNIQTGDMLKVPALKKQKAVIMLFRNSILTAGAPITSRAMLVALWKKAQADATTTAQLNGLQGLDGLSESLGDLEGRIARKIKKVAKKTVAVAKKAAKVVKPFAKIAAMAVGIPPLPYAKLAKQAVKGVKVGVKVGKAIGRRV